MEIETQYLNYVEYKAMGGSLDQMPFNLLEKEAEQYVDKYTFGRLKDLEEQLQDTKLCIFKLIDVIDSYNEYETQKKGISSENTDGYSVSYTTPSTDLSKVKGIEVYNIINTYLADCKLENGIPYLYRGTDISDN